MTITLYKIPDDKKVVDKTLNPSTNLGDLTAHFKEDTDVLNPVLEIAYNATYTTANYCYISDWGRWYYITGIETGAQRLYLSCHVDVLYTYRTDIRKITAIVERLEDKSKGKLYMSDIAFKAEARKIISTRKLSGSFNKAQSSYILTTGGRS